MSPFLSSYSVHEYKQSRQFQSLLFILRLLVAATLGFQVYQSSTFSQFFSDPTIFTVLTTYSVFALIGYLLVIVKPTHPVIFYHALVLDTAFALALPFLLPNQASIAISMVIIFAIAALKDLKANLLFLLSASYVVSACLAGWYFDSLKHSDVQSSHLMAVSLFVLACLYYLRTQFLNAKADLNTYTNGNTILQKRHLIDGLTYLYPYHQRNLTPLSLLLIRIEGASRHQKTIAQKLAIDYKKRLRRCDLLVQLDAQHLAVLLCDTSTSQCGQLVKALMPIKERLDRPTSHLTYGVCGLPLDQEISLEDILQQMICTLNQAEHQKVERLIFINAKKNTD